VGGTYSATLEQKHEDHSHTTRLSLAVSKVEKVTLPSLDDDFARKVTGGKTLTADELQQNIRKEIERYWNDLSARRLDDDLSAEVVRNNEITVPPSLTESFLDAMIEDVRNRSRERQLPRDFDDKAFREEIVLMQYGRPSGCC
jgi:FKBP-type peptidyl-prolyl cis-trans isomerase (trigger factor)